MTYTPPTPQPLVCPNCRYDANVLGAERCEVCGHPLQAEKLSSALPRTKSTFALGGLGLALLLAVAGGTYFLWRNLSKTSTADNRISTPSNVQLSNLMQEVQGVPKGLFSYGGAHTFAAFAARGMNSAIAQAHPSFQLRYTEPLNKNPGSGTGIEMLINKHISFSQSARSLKDTESREAKTRGFQLNEVPVAFDGIAFYTHPDIDLASLSLDRVQAIFMGKVTNWQMVGGPNLSILPISVDPKLTSTIQALFEGMKGASLSPRAEIVRDYTTAIRKVKATPGAIAYASASLIMGQQGIHVLNLAKARSNKYIKVLTDRNQVNEAAFRDGTYPFTRRLFVIIRQDGTLDEQAGKAYANLLLSNEGQQIIRKSGFVPIR
jgi:phosphate transport system substrate-binding protein